MEKREFIIKHKLIIAAILLNLFAIFLYNVSGYGFDVLALWLLSLFLVGHHYYKKSKNKIEYLDFKDFYWIVGLLLIFSPLYLAFLYNIPYQINTDEITIMHFERKFSNFEHDPFEISEYLSFPSMVFIIFGALGKTIGGINLFNMRLIHATFGILIIVATYLFFRTFTSKKYSAVGAIIIGANHSLLAISRMAMRDNTGLLVEIVALIFLILGIKNKNDFFIFLGAILTGLSMYGYLPGRAIIPIWFLSLGLLFFFFRKEIKTNNLVKYSFISVLVFLLTVSPILISSSKQDEAGLNYAKEQILLFPEGRALQQRWVGASTPQEAVKINIKNGLTMFNNKIHDLGYIYINRDNGFVDPLTGILVWIGFFVAIPQFKKRKEVLIAVSGFVFLLLFTSLLITKTPNYARIFVILIFSTFLVVEALKFIFNYVLNNSLKDKKSQKIVANFVLIFLVYTILAWNIAIFGKYVQEGFLNGNDVGGTARYIEQRNNFDSHSFYMVSNKQFQYYSWGEPYMWDTWMSFFTIDPQYTEVVDPINLNYLNPNKPFTMFMTNDLYNINEQNLRAKYPRLQKHNTMPNGRLVAIEVN